MRTRMRTSGVLEFTRLSMMIWQKNLQSKFTALRHHVCHQYFSRQIDKRNILTNKLESKCKLQRLFWPKSSNQSEQHPRLPTQIQIFDLLLFLFVVHKKSGQLTTRLLYPGSPISIWLFQTLHCCCQFDFSVFLLSDDKRLIEHGRVYSFNFRLQA